ncbi:MAG: MerR family transcriptional regulator, partial [Angustibacter sp.]
LDAHGISEMLRRSVRMEGVVATWETLATPVLVGLGERFAARNDGIEVEHLFSECLMGVFRSTVDQLVSPRNRSVVLLACPGDEQHSLPLYAMSAALAERGVGTRQLGMRVPTEALVSAVRRAGPGIVLLYASLPVPSLAALELIGRVRPAPRVLVGGPGWPAHLPPQVTRTWTLGETVEDIVASVL